MRLNKIQNKKFWVLIIALGIITIIPRGIELFSLSHYFGSEQGVEYLTTKKIVIDHQVVLVAHQGGFGGFLKPAGFNYLLAVPFILFNGDPYGARIFMCAISILTVLLGFIMLIKIFNKETAILVVFLMAISPALSHYAGRISPPFVIPILTVCLVYVIFNIFKKKYKYFIHLALIVGLMTNFEMATAATLATGFSILIFFFCIKKIVPYRYFFFFIVIALFFLLPLFLYDISHNFQNLIGIRKLLDAAIRHRGADSILNWRQIITNRASVFLWNFYSTFIPQKFVSIPLLIFMFLGTIFYTRDKKNLLENRLLVLFLLLAPLFTFLILMFYPDNIVQWWIIDLSIFYCYLVGIIAAYFWKKKFFRIFILLFIVIVLVGFAKRTYLLYKGEFAYPEGTYIIESKPIEYIYRDAKDKPFSILVYPTKQLQNYEYLIWWYGNNRYHHLPDKNKKGISLYILVENQNPKQSTKLLDSYNKGVVINTKNVNGFIVQKRLL